MSENVKTVLCFSLDNQTYGVEIGCIQEIVFGVKITGLPCLPPPFCGLCNYKGSVLPVVAGDAGKREEEDQKAVSLILHWQEYAFALLVDKEPFIAEVKEEQRKTDMAMNPDSGFLAVKEIYVWEEKLLSLLNIEKTIEHLTV